MYTTSVQHPSLPVHVTPRSGGVFTHGNRNSVSTAPEMTPGLLAPVSNRSRLCNSKPPRVKVIRAARPANLCPGCGIVRPLTGRCDQCW